MGEHGGVRAMWGAVLGCCGCGLVFVRDAAQSA